MGWLRLCHILKNGGDKNIQRSDNVQGLDNMEIIKHWGDWLYNSWNNNVNNKV